MSLDDFYSNKNHNVMTSSFLISQRKVDYRPVNWSAQFSSGPSNCGPGMITVPLLGLNSCSANKLCVPRSDWQTAPITPQKSQIIRHTDNLYGMTQPAKICQFPFSENAADYPPATHYLWEQNSCPRSRIPPDLEFLLSNDYFNLIKRRDGTGFRDITDRLSPRYYPDALPKYDVYHITEPDTLRVSYGTQTHHGK